MNLPILKDLHIRITSSCNFNCPHCYAADWFKKKYELTDEEVFSVVTQAIDLGCQKVTFTGGEPLMAASLVSAVSFCLSKGLRVEIETNGVLLDNLCSALLDDVKKIEFAVSYDGGKMRDKKYVSTVCNNIVHLVQLGCDVKIQTVLTKLNIDEIDQIFHFSKQYNIRNRCFLAHSPNGNGKNIPLFDIMEWLRIVKLIKTNYPHVIVELPDVLSGGMQKKCGWGVHRCEVMPNGDVTSCGPITFNYRNFVAGNIRKEKLSDIWGSNHFEYIRSLKQSDFVFPCCNCIYWNTCLGACRSISYSTGGNLLSPHPFCSSLFYSLKSGIISEELLPDSELVDKWVKGLEKQIKGKNETYELSVKRQHKLL